MKKTAFAIAVLFIFSCSPKVMAPQPPPLTPEPPAVATKSSFELAGQEIYNTKCADCHKLFAPTDYTMERWIPIMDVMAHNAALTSDQKQSVLAYIASEIK